MDEVAAMLLSGVGAYNDSPAFGSATEVVTVDEDIDPTTVVYEADASTSMVTA